jgi:DNA polymerase I
MRGTLIFDIETHSQELLWSMPPEEFVRLIGYRWRHIGQTVLTTDLDEIRDQILSAHWIIGHRVHQFDLPAVFGVKSDIPLQLAMERRVYDTWTHAVLVHPAPYSYVDRHGKPAKADKPERMTKWFGLDEQAHQLGVPGKTHDLRVLAKEFEDPELKGEARKRSGFGRIPVDDERYRDYLRGDVAASEVVAQELLKRGPLDEYAMREQELEARAFVIRSNGFRVNQEKARARRDELAARREVIMAGLVRDYDFPTAGKSPWSTNQGKDAIFRALEDAGVSEKTYPNWPRTDTGNLQLGGEVLIELTKGTDAEELGQALAELKGQRSLSQLALDSVYPDGFAHPEITMLQRSGRWSTTEPGLTIWTARGPGAVEREYFGPDNDDEVLLGIDLSNADARIVAWYSGDEKYAERFLPGADGHLINAWAAWGKDVVGTDKHDPVTAAYRQKAKPLGHGWSYGGRAKKLSAQAGVPLEDAESFVDGMDRTFHRVVAWQNSVRRYAHEHGYVLSAWGRKLYIEKGREFTQAPALLGQNGTRELIADALLAMPIHVLRRVKAQIHDELVFSVPRRNFEACRDYLVKLMTTDRSAPRGGQRMDFPASASPAGENWYEATEH